MKRRHVIEIGLGVIGSSLIGAAHAAPAESTKDYPLIKKDRELTKEECKYILDHVHHAVLSTVDAAGIPYGVPISPVYIDGKIYFHGVTGKGRRAMNLKQNPNVSLTYIANDEIDKGQFAVNFASVIVQGKVRPLPTKEEKAAFLKKLAMALDPTVTEEATIKHINRPFKLDVIDIFEITPTRITGKARAKEKYFGKK